MKKVFSNSELPHVWANRQQSEGTTPNRNFYFHGDIIYSYGSHFPIAKFVKDSEGAEAVLFTNRSYSNSTAKHIGQTHRAIPHGINIIYCYDPGNTNSFGHIDNFKVWYKQLDAQARKLQNARKPEIYLNAISQISKEAKIYADFFKIDLPADIVEISTIENKEQFAGIYAKRLEREKLEAEKALKAKNKAIKEQLKKWREFKTNNIHTKIDFDFLRFNAENKRVETSQGVQIPGAIALQFYNFVIEKINAGGCSDCEQTLINYDVKQINKKFIVVGCHKIELKEINLILPQLTEAVI